LEYLDDNRVELYNLREDPTERHNVAKQMPDRAAELRERLHAWRDSVGAALPKPNPDFQGGKPKPQYSQVTP
jgi:arylsulfatase A-like enzyme